MLLAWNGPTVHHSPIGLPVCTKHTAADLFASSLLFQHPRNNSSVDCWTISAHICFLPCSPEVAASKPTLDWLTVSSFPLTWWHFNAFYASLDIRLRTLQWWDTRVKEPKNYSLFFLLTCLFQDVKGDHFRLRGTLPGYSMHRSSNGDEPLNVQVAGRTLVVQGSKRLSARKRISFCFAFTFVGWEETKDSLVPFTVLQNEGTGNMMTSFQRSFPLPWEPDPEKVAVTYGVPWIRIGLAGWILGREPRTIHPRFQPRLRMVPCW